MYVQELEVSWAVEFRVQKQGGMLACQVTLACTLPSHMHTTVTSQVFQCYVLSLLANDKVMIIYSYITFATVVTSQGLSQNRIIPSRLCSCRVP